jgi:hypothetical protein
MSSLARVVPWNIYPRCRNLQHIVLTAPCSLSETRECLLRRHVQQQAEEILADYEL